jgi:hypothetical protein
VAEDKPLPEIIAERLSAYVGSSADSLHKVKFGRGAVGKVAVIIAVALLALGAIGVRVGGTGGLVLGGGIVAVTLAGLGVILYVVIWRPELAVLEGTELVMYKHVTLGAKGLTQIPNSPVIPDPSGGPPLLEPPQEPEQ